MKFNSGGDRMDQSKKQFHSVEFALNAPQPLYQFRIWRSTQNDPFLLVKENSKVLTGLKVGTILPMKYYGGEALNHSEIRTTQIRQIVSETQGRFQGHCRVEIAILSNESQSAA
jgi:hypothetical protein